MKIQIINGPNLNLLGKREPDIYGNRSFEDYLPTLQARFPDIELHYYQSNVEGELINKLQDVHQREDFRHHSFLSPACLGVICGFGLHGYAMAIDGIIAHKSKVE